VQGPFDPSVRRPFKRVIFDGHRIDAVFVLQLDDGSFVELQRVWLLVVQDVGSAAILAYSLCFRAEFSADDVLLCLKRAVMPWRRTEVSVTGLTYPERGGMSNEVLPQLCWVCWDEVWFDRAGQPRHRGPLGTLGMHGCLGQLWAARDADVSGPHRKMLSPVGGGRLCQAPEHDGTPPGGSASAPPIRRRRPGATD
jgi:hypothetical protein